LCKSAKSHSKSKHFSFPFILIIVSSAA
jgi:hypothetical protein